MVADTKVYGMAECWKTLNKTECSECFSNARNNVLSCLPAKDSIAMNAGCFVRYSTDPFYLSSSSSGNGSSGKLIWMMINNCYFLRIEGWLVHSRYQFPEMNSF